MADNYTSAAFVLKFISKDAQKMFLDLAEAADRASYEPEELTDEQKGLLTEAGFENFDELYQLAEDVDEYHDTGVYVHSSESLDLELIAMCAHAVMRKFGGDPVSFQWADTCSKGRIDEFGGGGCVVTADDIHWLSTSSWVDEKLKSLAARQPT